MNKIVFLLAIAFFASFTLFLSCFSKLEQKQSFILNANVTKEQQILLSSGIKLIYYEYDYFFDNQTYTGANAEYFYLNDALKFSNLTTLPIYICKNDLNKSRFRNFQCNLEFDQILIFVGALLGAIGSFCLFIILCAINLERDSVTSNEFLANKGSLKQRRRVKKY